VPVFSPKSNLTCCAYLSPFIVVFVPVPITRRTTSRSQDMVCSAFAASLIFPASAVAICYLLLIPRSLSSPTRSDGRVAEWSNVPDSKSGDRAIGPWVRIPPLPLSLKELRKLHNSSKRCAAVLLQTKCTKMAVFGYELPSLHWISERYRSINLRPFSFTVGSALGTPLTYCATCPRRWGLANRIRISTSSFRESICFL
jgi:hypothetical protein